MRPLLILVLLTAPVLAAGCFGATTSPVEVTPYLPLNDAAPGRATEFAFHLRSTSPFRQELPVTVRGLPTNWTFASENDTVNIIGGATSSLTVRITPGPDAAFGPHTLGVMVGDTPADVIVNVADLGDEPARAGVGVKVRYVLWYDNGTLAGTNEPTVLSQPGMDAPVLDQDVQARDMEALKVYVGGQRGTPPPEPYNSTGYLPVIRGFDARLQDTGDGQGMVAGETLAVRVPAHLAYTYDGNEDHVLYGENLNFLARVESVDVLQARTCDLPVCPT